MLSEKKGIDRSVRRKKLRIRGGSELPDLVAVAGSASPGSPRRSSNDWVRNDMMMIGPRATSRALKATEDQALLESDKAPNSRLRIV